MWYSCTECAFQSNSNKSKVIHEQQTGHVCEEDDDE
jgi:hypothetical protein